MAETDPFLLPFIALWSKIRHGCRFVAYLQDIYPDIAVAVGKVREGLLTRFLRRSLWFTYRFADRIVVLSEDMKQRCIRNGARPEAIVVVRNWADTDAITPIGRDTEFRRQHQLNGEFVVMYSGNHGLAHELMPIIDAAEELQDTDPDILFAFVGGGVRRAELESAAEERGLTNVRFFPYQPWGELSESLGAGDVQLLSVKAAASDCMSPSKLYGILAAGRPVVALIDPKSSHARLIEHYNVGVVCDVTQPDECGQKLAIALASLRRDASATSLMGRRARKLAVNRFSRTLQTQRFATMLGRLIGAATTPKPASGSKILRSVPQAQKDTAFDIPVFDYDHRPGFEDSIHYEGPGSSEALDPNWETEESGVNLG